MVAPHSRVRDGCVGRMVRARVSTAYNANLEVNRDDYISRWKTSNFGYQEVLKAGIY